jgi:hypothetical protein
MLTTKDVEKFFVYGATVLDTVEEDELHRAAFYEWLSAHDREVLLDYGVL